MENLSNEFEDELGHKVSKFSKTKIAFYLFGVLIFLYFIFLFFFSAPADFPLGVVIKVDKGSSLRSISSMLEKEHIIRSRVAFEFFVIILGGEKHIISANYLFDNKLSVFEVARRISRGEHHMVPIRITIPEGSTNSEIANIFSAKLPEFNKENFLLSAKFEQGFLFPDTYFFFVIDTEKEVFQSITKNFAKKVTPLLPQIIKGEEEDAIIIMASILEKEAKGDTDRAIISGILWKRISIHMPLQVDAAPNTYKVWGLPKDPISNPGLEAITAAIHPQSSPYLYYLHDKDGIAHYARTLSEHDKNINKYLK